MNASLTCSLVFANNLQVHDFDPIDDTLFFNRSLYELNLMKEEDVQLLKLHYKHAIKNL